MTEDHVKINFLEHSKTFWNILECGGFPYLEHSMTRTGTNDKVYV